MLAADNDRDVVLLQVFESQPGDKVTIKGMRASQKQLSFDEFKKALGPKKLKKFLDQLTLKKKIFCGNCRQHGGW